jgi:hypothetical protein
MHSLLRAVFLSIFISVVSFAGVFPDFGYTPPADWTGSTFVLSQNYPASPSSPQVFPWESIDYTQNPIGYLNAVITYCYEGNLAADFKPEKNTIRTWFHAPWLHYGPNGREFVNGLTRERISRPYELSATQTQSWRNFAVGFYNAPGGYTLGTVWANPNAPKVSGVAFPEGTVSFKLLFTTAPVASVPMLAGSPEWAADIDRSSTAAAVLANKVRLLQIDIAVKDKRSNCGGWIFGTFHYDASIPAASPWLKLRPLTLQWGNDPKLTPAMFHAGTKPLESWVNPNSPLTIYRQNPPSGATPPNTFGWAGRGNGPVDNPVSACMSCHGTAQIPAAASMIPTASLPDSGKLHWFRNLAPHEAFSSGSESLDFSLQLGVGIQNFQAAHATGPASIQMKGAPVSSPAQDGQPAVKEHLFTRDL